jgi:hypothetical protein
LALAEILASLALPAARGFALCHLIQMLLLEGLNLPGEFGTELVTA